MSVNPPRDKSPAGAIGAGLLAVLMIGLWWVFDRSEAARPPPAPATIPVVVTRAMQQDVLHVTRAVGTVQSLHSVTVRPQVSGVLNEVLFQEGEKVQQGELLARIDDRSIAAQLTQARAAKARNVAQLDSARIDLRRYQDLVKSGVVPAQTLDQQQALVDQLIAAVAADDAAIAVAEVQLSYTRIVSPVSGRAGMRRVDPGNLVQAGESEGLVTVTQLDPIAVVFSLPQHLLPVVRTLAQGTTAARVTAFDRDGGTELGRGVLTLIDNQIDTRSGTIRVKSEFPNPDGRLWPGQFVAVQLDTGTSEDALVIPAAAVQRGRDFLYVYRVADGKADVVPVTLSYEDNALAVVTGGLTAGDVVVNEGQSRLKPGAAVQIAADATRAGPAPIDVR